MSEKVKSAKPNLGVLKDYKKREEEFLRRAKDLEQITEARDAQKQTYDGLRKQRLDEFMAGFNLISLKLKEMYQVQYQTYFHAMLCLRSYPLDDNFRRQCRTRAG